MPVLKTISPNVSPSAPKAVPCSVMPSSRTSRAGGVMSGQLSVEHGGRAAQEGGHHPAWQLQAGERRVAALRRAGRDHRLGGRRGGGLTLNTGSYPAASSSVSSK